MVSSRKLVNLLFYVMLEFPLLWSPVPTNFMNTSVLLLSMLLLQLFFLFFKILELPFHFLVQDSNKVSIFLCLQYEAVNRSVSEGFRGWSLEFPLRGCFYHFQDFYFCLLVFFLSQLLNFIIDVCPYVKKMQEQLKKLKDVNRNLRKEIR